MPRRMFSRLLAQRMLHLEVMALDLGERLYGMWEEGFKTEYQHDLTEMEKKLLYVRALDRLYKRRHLAGMHKRRFRVVYRLVRRKQ